MYTGFCMPSFVSMALAWLCRIKKTAISLFRQPWSSHDPMDSLRLLFDLVQVILLLNVVKTKKTKEAECRSDGCILPQVYLPRTLAIHQVRIPSYRRLTILILMHYLHCTWNSLQQYQTWVLTRTLIPYYNPNLDVYNYLRQEVWIFDLRWTWLSLEIDLKPHLKLMSLLKTAILTKPEPSLHRSLYLGLKQSKPHEESRTPYTLFCVAGSSQKTI